MSNETIAPGVAAHIEAAEHLFEGMAGAIMVERNGERVTLGSVQEVVAGPPLHG